MVHFINADLIASGLSPLDLKLAAVAAGRLVLAEIKRLAALRVDFAFESIWSGVGYVRHLIVEGRHYGDPGVVRLVQQSHAQPRLDARVFITQSADAR